MKNQNLGPHQGDKSNSDPLPNPHQRDADPQHCLQRTWEASVTFLNYFVLCVALLLLLLLWKSYFASTFMRKDPDPYIWLMDPDPGGPKTCGSCGFGSPTLILSYNPLEKLWYGNFLNYFVLCVALLLLLLHKGVEVLVLWDGQHLVQHSIVAPLVQSV